MPADLPRHSATRGQEGEFTLLVKAVNGAGGLLFFLPRAFRPSLFANGNTDDLIFTALCCFLGWVGLLFVSRSHGTPTGGSCTGCG